MTQFNLLQLLNFSSDLKQNQVEPCRRQQQNSKNVPNCEIEIIQIELINPMNPNAYRSGKNLSNRVTILDHHHRIHNIGHTDQICPWHWNQKLLLEVKAASSYE